MATEKLSEIKLYYKPRKSIGPRITCSKDAYNQALKFFDKNTMDPISQIPFLIQQAFVE